MTWEAHHSPRASPSGCGELPRSLMRQQWPQYWYQFLNPCPWYLLLTQHSSYCHTIASATTLQNIGKYMIGICRKHGYFTGYTQWIYIAMTMTIRHSVATAIVLIHVYLDYTADPRRKKDTRQRRCSPNHCKDIVLSVQTLPIMGNVVD